MLYQEWPNSLSLPEFVSNEEDLYFGVNPYQDAEEVIGEFPELNRKVIMRKELTRWELFLKEGESAMRQTCASPWGDHIVRCAEYIYGRPLDGWKITKRIESGERQTDPARGRAKATEAPGERGKVDEYTD